jgi:SAM-dependent methyltransferase
VIYVVSSRDDLVITSCRAVFMKTQKKLPPYIGYDTRIDWHSPELATLVAAGMLPDGRALDMGCGHGTESIFLAEMGWKVVGIDFDEDGKALRLAKDRRGRMSARVRANLQFIRGDALQFREKTPGTFDVVIDRLLITNFSGTRKIVRALRAAAYALRKKGVFVLRIGLPWHPVPVRVDLSGFFSDEDVDFLKRYFDFDPASSLMVGYRGLVTPCEESGVLVTSSQPMGILLLHRNGERMARLRRNHKNV